MHMAHSEKLSRRLHTSLKGQGIARLIVLVTYQNSVTKSKCSKQKLTFAQKM